MPRFAVLALAVWIGFPSEPRAENTLPCNEGYDALTNGAYEQSLELFSLCLQDGNLSLSNRAIAFTNRGNAYEAMGQYDRALAEYDRAIAVQPDYVIAHMNRGIARSHQGDLTGAIEDLERARQLDAFNPAVLNALCWTHNLLALPRKSLGYCDFSWARASKVANTLDTRAFAYWQLGLDERAINDLNQAHSLDPAGGYDPQQRLSEFPIVLTQGLLTALGYAPGIADGAFKPETQAAIEAFQRDRGLPVDGNVSETLIASLKEAKDSL